jgi:hypothetical protein
MDCNLLWDASRKCIELLSRPHEKRNLGGWRKNAYWKSEVKNAKRACERIVSRGGPNKAERVLKAVQEATERQGPRSDASAIVFSTSTIFVKRLPNINEQTLDGVSVRFIGKGRFLEEGIDLGDLGFGLIHEIFVFKFTLTDAHQLVTIGTSHADLAFARDLFCHV